MSEKDMPLERLTPLIDSLAAAALPLWDVPAGAKARRINVSENFTYLVEAEEGFRAVLRVHRQGYHSRRAIECELAWIEALGMTGAVATPQFFPGRDGDPIQTTRIDELDRERHLVLFGFIEGETPDLSGDVRTGFRSLGEIAAHCHEHVTTWPKPAPFERLVWDDEAVFGRAATWGDWRDAPGVTSEIRTVLEQVEGTIRRRLTAYGKGADRFDLIHADMRLANLIVGEDGPRLIDFDDCGFGWFMYDFAAAISFIEDDPRIAEMKAAWVEGYRAVRTLSKEDEDEIETFVMLRRMALLAWIGSHIEAPEPQAMAPHFAAGTAKLGAAFLDRFASG